MVEPGSRKEVALVGLRPPWGKQFEHLTHYLKALHKKYGGRLPYAEELRKSPQAEERAFFYVLSANRILHKSPSLDILPTFGEIKGLEAEQEYRAHYFFDTRGKLALLKPSLHKRLWRHRKKGSLEIVPLQERAPSPWKKNPWEHYLAEHRGKTRGEVNKVSNAFYKALRRQVLAPGTILLDGSVLEKECFAIERVPVSRKRKGS